MMRIQASPVLYAELIDGRRISSYHWIAASTADASGHVDPPPLNSKIMGTARAKYRGSSLPHRAIDGKV